MDNRPDDEVVAVLVLFNKPVFRSAGAFQMLTWNCERTPSPRRQPASGNSMVRREKVLRPGP
jgi:hypothetical protein